MGPRKNKDKSKNGSKASGPSEKRDDIKPYGPAKEAPTSEDILEIRGEGLHDVENPKYRKAVKQALQKLKAKVSVSRDVFASVVQWKRWHPSTSDKSQVGHVVSLRVYNADEDWNSEYGGTLHAMADGNYTLKRKGSETYVNSKNL